MRYHLSPEAIFKLGLIQCHHSKAQIDRTCYKTNLHRFKGAYYACPTVVFQIWRDIQDEELVGEKRIKNPKPNQVLLALRFLKQYPTKETIAGFGSCTEKTALVRCWKYVEAIQALAEKKVSHHVVILFSSNL